MHQKDAEGIANCVDPDGAVWYGSALFAQTCLSKKFENYGNILKAWNSYLSIYMYEKC